MQRRMVACSGAEELNTRDSMQWSWNANQFISLRLHNDALWAKLFSSTKQQEQETTNELSVRACTYTHTHTCTSTHTNAHTHTNMYKHTHIHTNTYTHKHVQTHTQACTSTHIHTYTHTNTHIHTPVSPLGLCQCHQQCVLSLGQ